MKNGLDWASKAWYDLPTQVVRRCFIKSGILSAPQCALLEQSIDRKLTSGDHSAIEELQEMLKDLDVSYKEVSKQLGVKGTSQLGVEDVICLEDQEVMDEISKCNETKILGEVLRENEIGTSNESDSSDMKNVVKLKRHEVLAAINTMTGFLDMLATSPGTEEPIQELARVLQKSETLASSYFDGKKVQTKVSSFFQRSFNSL